MSVKVACEVALVCTFAAFRVRKRQLSGILRHMDKHEHAERLRLAIARRGLTREQVALATNHEPRSVTNWTRGKTMPTEATREALRRLLGEDYDVPGDPVEQALAVSELVDWRQDAVRSFYRRNLAEQRADRRGASA